MLRIVALRLMYCRGLALYFSHGFPSFCCYPYSHLDLLVLSKPREVFCKGLVKNTLQIASRRSYAEGTGPGQCQKPGFREYFIPETELPRRVLLGSLMNRASSADSFYHCFREKPFLIPGTPGTVVRYAKQVATRYRRGRSTRR